MATLGQTLSHTLIPTLSTSRSRSHSHHNHNHNHNHNNINDEEEAEYDRLRHLAQVAHDRRQNESSRGQAAYERDDHAAAHEHSERAKQYQRDADDYARQASDYIFRVHNSFDRVDADTIDLHGQYVSEAEDILERRLRRAGTDGRTRLTVWVDPDSLARLKSETGGMGNLNHLMCFFKKKRMMLIFISLESSAEATTPPTTCRSSNPASKRCAASTGYATTPIRRMKAVSLSIC